LVGYLSYGSVEDPHTLVSGVKAVPAGHTMTLKLDDDCLELVEPEPYWEVAIGSSNRVTREEASSRVRDALRQSVELHMASDVPLGAFLSGGIDSSSIVSLMADNARRIHTLTIGFSEANFDESHVARSVASRYGTQHHEICLTAEAFLKDLPNWIRSQDQPSADGANTWAISRACREAGIVVALSGLGGDELFGGYSTFKYTQQFRRLYEHIKWMPPQVRQQIASGLMTVAGNRSTAFRKAAECFSGDGRVTSTYLTLRRFFLSDAMKDLLEPHVNDLVLPSGLHAAVINRLRDYDRSSDTLRAVSALEVNSYLVNTLLRDADQMSMAHSVEMRVPFIDVDVVNTAMSVPGGLIRQNGQPKALLCDAMGSNLDRSWIERPKMGFVFPFDRWLGGALSGEIAAGLATLNRPPFKKNAVLSTWHRYRSGDPAVKSSHILSLYALASWMSTHGVEMPA
jgi:asparagine synthase (glutamine-hydrolysing)